jgi:UPF0271 protein
MTKQQFTKSIDLNADIGEYTGTSGAALDNSILDLVSSASIACGAHAGDLEVMQRTVDSALKRGVTIGAHPSYPDRENFGRREMEILEEELTGQLVSQIEALAGCCAKAGAKLSYVKPHGALYNVAARDAQVARVIAEAVCSVDPSLVLLGLADSTMIYEAEHAGLAVACEAFADRAYLANGTLLPRQRAGAVLTDARVVAERALTMARDHFVSTVDDARLAVQADSLCFHGDNPEAVALVTATKAALEADGFMIRPFA